MSEARLDRAIRWTRAAKSIVAPLAGLGLAIIGIREIVGGNTDGAALWFIAALLTRLGEE